jgi:alkylation response protein AidB-like acyl-CoA dehydrogenase
VFEAMARIDTSTGWALMITASLSAIAGAYLPEQGVQEVFAGRSPLFAGLLMPGGVLRAVPGGFRVDGRWAFGSGIRHADFIVTSAIVQETPPAAAGMRDLRTIVVPAREATVEDTWHAAGLRGSGSEHYHMRDVFVPEHRVFAFPAARAQRGGPLYELPLIAMLSAAHAGFALGAGRAALDAIADTAPARVKAWPQTPLASHTAFQMDLGRADAKLRAARAYSYEAMGKLETRMLDGLPLSDGDWRDARLAVTFATDVAAEVTTFAFRAGGSGALYNTSPLQRLFRDVHAAAQHIAATDDAYEYAGRLLLGAVQPHPLMGARPSS